MKFARLRKLRRLQNSQDSLWDLKMHGEKSPVRRGSLVERAQGMHLLLAVRGVEVGVPRSP